MYNVMRSLGDPDVLLLGSEYSVSQEFASKSIHLTIFLYYSQVRLFNQR